MSIRIAKAIEILTLDQNENRGKLPPDLEESRALALEALEEITYLRAANKFLELSFLPTEMPEQA